MGHDEPRSGAAPPLRRGGDRRLTATAGLVGAALFVAVFTVEGLLRPGYDPWSSFVSELALGPRGWIQNANFVASGALILALSRGLAGEFLTGKASRAGPTMIAFIGAGLLASGPAVMDRPGTPLDQATTAGLVHSLLGAVVFTLAPTSAFVFYRRFREDPRWRALAGSTLATAIVTTAAVVLMRVGPARPPAPPNPWNQWSGALQRAVLIPWFAWLFAVALRLRLLAGGDAAASR
ncbi:MAG: DUF998 domain-containing protein [Nannocystaceae bacterium]